jgi:hypothetical protein
MADTTTVAQDANATTAQAIQQRWQDGRSTRQQQAGDTFVRVTGSAHPCHARLLWLWLLLLLCRMCRLIGLIVMFSILFFLFCMCGMFRAGGYGPYAGEPMSEYRGYGVKAGQQTPLPPLPTHSAPGPVTTTNAAEAQVV